MKTRLGHYDIVAELGRGGMGVVYKGYEASLNRYVAIKVLADSLAHDAGVKERFLREARSMAALNDPHIIQIYFIGEDEGQPYFVMEFVEGESLSALLKREHRLPVSSAAKIVQQTAIGLAAAHDKGVVHRDIKPGNLMISSRGTVKIADFGIALSNQDLSAKLTSTGEFVGTPGYLSPEVCLGKVVDQRSDIFALGVVWFEMLVGRMPFTDESPLGLMLEVVRAEIPDVRELNADVDEQLAFILSSMIAKEPVDRYQNCHELAADLAAHPLLANGQLITLVPQMSPAAATLIGQKTPLPGAPEQRVTSPTPTPLQAEAATRITPNAQSAAPPRPSVLEKSANEKSRSAFVPLALVALLLLGVFGGAWAFRGHIPGLSGLLGQDQIAATDAGAENGIHVTDSVAPADSRAETAASTPINADTVLFDSSPVSQPASAATDGVASSEAAGSTSTLPDADSSATQIAGSEGAMDDNAASASDGQFAAAAMPVSDSVDMSGAPLARAAQADLDALRDLPAARAGEAAVAPLASRTPVAKPAPTQAPREPTIAVVVSGDEVISEPARDALVSLLKRRGFRVIEGGETNASQPDMRALRGRADAVVFVQAKPIGSQDITFYGQV
ncbi:MAG: protein kinase, partial [Dokdonella sp.]